MRIITLIATIFIATSLSAQSPKLSLVQDYIPGPQGSTEGRMYQFQNSLTYVGMTFSGERAILQYDKSTDEISVLITETELGGIIDFITSNGEEVVMFIGDDFGPNRILRGQERDLSDLAEVYNSGEKYLNALRFYNEDIIINEFDASLPQSLSFKLIRENGEVTSIIDNLPGLPWDYSFGSAAQYIFIANEMELINGQSIIAFDSEIDQIIPIDQAIPNFFDCGVVPYLRTGNNRFLNYRCDTDFIYDFDTEQYINFDGEFTSVFYDRDNFVYLLRQGALFRQDLNTNDVTLIFDDFTGLRAFIGHMVIIKDNNGLVQIDYFNANNDEYYSYPTSYEVETFGNRITGFALTDNGLYTVLYENDSDNGILVDINDEKLTVIDSVYNVNFLNRPVFYDQDIYISHQNLEYGNEIFIVDQQTSTLAPIDNSEITIYPNPTASVINVRNHHKYDHILISDSKGAVIIKTKSQQTIDLAHLNQGMYTISFITNDKTLNTTSIIKK